MFEKSNALSDDAQLGRVNAPGRVALGRIPADEPIFTLRAQDLFAPALVRLWASLNALNPTCKPTKLKEARDIAEAMERWPTRKFPD